MNNTDYNVKLIIMDFISEQYNTMSYAVNNDYIETFKNLVKAGYPVYSNFITSSANSKMMMEILKNLNKSSLFYDESKIINLKEEPFNNEHAKILNTLSLSSNFDIYYQAIIELSEKGFHISSSSDVFSNHLKVTYHNENDYRYSELLSLWIDDYDNILNEFLKDDESYCKIFSWLTNIRMFFQNSLNECMNIKQKNTEKLDSVIKTLKKAERLFDNFKTNISKNVEHDVESIHLYKNTFNIINISKIFDCDDNSIDVSHQLNKVNMLIKRKMIGINSINEDLDVIVSACMKHKGYYKVFDVFKDNLTLNNRIFKGNKYKNINTFIKDFYLKEAYKIKDSYNMKSGDKASLINELNDNLEKFINYLLKSEYNIPIIENCKTTVKERLELKDSCRDKMIVRYIECGLNIIANAFNDNNKKSIPFNI